MTLPNKITIARICLIPVFALVAWAYGASFGNGRPDERLRVAATGIFILAAATDGLDGFIARRFNQTTRLGSILDPIADKCLVATAVLAIALSQWPHAFPVWFAVAVLPTPITSDLRSHRRLAARSAMSSRFRCAAVTTARSTVMEMKRFGGIGHVSMPLPRLACFG